MHKIEVLRRPLATGNVFCQKLRYTFELKTSDRSRPRETENSLVEALNAVYLIRGVHGERYTVQALSANDAGEARRMIRLAGGPQYSIQYRSDADATLLQSVEIVLLAVRLAVQRVEGLPLQIDLAYEATEATYVKNFVHRRASGALSLDLAPALSANTINVTVFAVIRHPLNQQIRENVDLPRETQVFH